MESERKKVLIVVKTYPHPSKKTKETVCTAGITDKSEWIRLYPIPYRFLDGRNQFKIFDWIEVETRKRPPYKDKRPESHSIEAESIRIIGHLDNKKDIVTRYKYISAMEQPSYEKLKDLHDNQGISLGIIKPKIMNGLSLVKDTDDWTDEQKRQLNQLSIWDPKADITPLRKVPYKIKCSFVCDDPGCKGHNFSLTSWEYNLTLLKLLDDYKQEKQLAEQELQRRWMKNFNEKIGYLILGTVNQMEKYGGTFIIIGHCSFPKGIQNQGEQLSLF